MTGSTAFVLAAGLGTRLRPLTDVRPKPLVPICGVPILAWTLALAARHGMRRAVVNAHWHPEQILSWRGEQEGVYVDVIVEPEILGTGGGLRNASDRLGSCVTVLNGDILTDLDLTALAAAVPHGGAALALRVAPEEAFRYGVVATDSTGAVVRLRSYDTPATGAVTSDTHFTGLYALDRSVVNRIGPGFQDVVSTAFRSLMADRNLVGVRTHATWIDIGDLESYLSANMHVLSGGFRGPVDPHARAAFARRGGITYGDPDVVRGVVTHGDVWVGHSVQIDTGAVLRDCVIGHAARIDAVLVERSVVWDDVHLSQPVRNGVAYHSDRPPIELS